MVSLRKLFTRQDATEGEGTARPAGRSAGLVLALTIMSALLPALWNRVGATHVNPIFTAGNPTCSDLVESDAELRVQPVADGTYSDGVLSVTIDVRDTAAGPVFDFTSNLTVVAVFVKGGPDGNLYDYRPTGTTADTGLHAPVNPNNNTYFGLSHISFCYNPVPSTEATVSASEDVVHSGDTVTFTITEENDGVLPLTGANVVTDSTACNAALTGPTGDDGDGVLEPGETWTWTCTIAITGDPGTFTLTVTGHGTDPEGDDVTWCVDPSLPPANTFCDQDERDSVDVDIIRPSTVVSVSANPTVIHSGDSVTFTITETNDAPPPLTNVSVQTDSAPCNAALSGPTGDDGDNVLEQNETWTWTCTIPVTGDAASDFTLVVTGHGTDPTGADVTFCEVGQPTTGKFCDADERDSVIVDIIRPSTIVSVTANPTAIESGDSVTFTITETNDAPEPLTNVSVETDSAACDAALVGPTGDDGDNVLEQGETWTWTCTITVTGDPATDFTLVVTGHGIDPTGADVTFCEVGQPTTGKFCDPDERDSVTVDIQEVGEGLTPGFWKNHLGSWLATGFSPNQTLESVFDVPNSLGLDNATLLQALSFSGGSGTKGAAQTLFRAAVAALLNSAHPNIDYPRTTAEVISDVNAALASGSRSTMLVLAAELDADNNLGGDINS